MTFLLISAWFGLVPNPENAREQLIPSLLLGAPYMIAVEYFPVQAVATLSIEGLVVKHGKVVRFPFSQQQKREKHRALQCHPIKMHDTGNVQGADLPQPLAGPGIVSNPPEQ